MSMHEMWNVRCDKTGCVEEDTASGSKKQTKKDFEESGWVIKRVLTVCPKCMAKTRAAAQGVP